MCPDPGTSAGNHDYSDRSAPCFPSYIYHGFPRDQVPWTPLGYLFRDIAIPSPNTTPFVYNSHPQSDTSPSLFPAIYLIPACYNGLKQSLRTSFVQQPPSRSEICAVWREHMIFAFRQNPLISGHPPRPRLSQWTSAIPTHPLHLTGDHPAPKFCAVWRQRTIFMLDMIPSFPTIHRVLACCSWSVPSPHIPFTRLVTIPLANSARFVDNARFSRWTQSSHFQSSTSSQLVAMDLHHTHAFPSLDWLPSRSQILRGLATTRDFHVGRNPLISDHPPHPSLLQLVCTIPTHSLHSIGHHPVRKFCTVW